ncbi:flagellar biosynthesis protein FlhF [Caldanaerobius fijiensis DSM 17918]|uniref:Flagellar biosynthesis protein FlhF n=2 Tax=Caldanaerobius TaxID=862261 RepID=A0A1M4XKX1_9THEO|nr:flagellar biosynthesis protein FlhF [Caldanaerobius fijiensis DSM 17918]
MIKKYIVSDMLEAHMKIKAELGEDAIILYTARRREKGIKGLFKKAKIEVIAAVENKQDDLNLRSIKKDIEIIKREIHVQKSANDADDNIYDNLLKKGFSPNVAREISAMYKNGEDTSDLKNYFIRKIGFASPLKLNSKPTVVLFVGPTGVGKTTTIAKMAANYVLNYNKNVAFVTADTYRIAAAEQLKIYADMIGAPIKVVDNSFELSLAIKSFEDKDIIFIDTAGRNHRSQYQMQNLRELIKNVKIDEVYLVINSSAKYIDISRILKEFSFLKYKIIFTKLDEAENLCGILETRYLTDAPFSYVTTGQSVPDDIELLNPAKVVEEILGGD